MTVDMITLLLNTIRRSPNKLVAALYGPEVKIKAEAKWISREEVMDSKRSDRRRFLKSAALAGLAAGAERSASAQSGGSEATPKETHTHGEPSRFAAKEGVR